MKIFGKTQVLRFFLHFTISLIEVIILKLILLFMISDHLFKTFFNEEEGMGVDNIKKYFLFIFLKSNLFEEWKYRLIVKDYFFYFSVWFL